MSPNENKGEKLQIGRIKAQLLKENPDLSNDELLEKATAMYKAKQQEKNPVKEPVKEPDLPEEEVLEEEIEKPKKGKKEVSNEDIMEVLQKQQKKIDELEQQNQKQKEVISVMQTKQPVAVGGTEVFEDYLKTPINFFCHLHQFAIASYKIKGIEILPPLGRIIKFRHTSRSKTNIHSQRDARVINLCTYNCRSKKEAEYIRACPDYGSIIFEKSSQALNVDIYEADMMKEASAEISNKSQHQIIEMAIAHDIPVSDDMAQMRRELVYKIGKQKLINFKEKSMKLARTAGNEELADKNVIEMK